MAKVPPKSVYKSPKSVALNQPVTISVDDPRAAWDKIGQTRARLGAELEIVGLDGIPLINGGKSLTASVGPPTAGHPSEPQRFIIPGINGGEASIQVGYGAIVPTAIANVSTAWSLSGSGPDLIVTFDWDYADPANGTVTEFILEVTADGVIRQTPYGSFPVNKTQTAQTVTITESIMSTTMGTLTKNVTKVCVYAIDAFYNKSSSVCDNTVPVHILDLPVPVITVSQAVDGYNVAYTIPTQSGFDAIDIVEYESNASTEPTSVTYSRVYFSGISPANILTLNLNSRWVKARFSSRWGAYTAFSAAQKVTPLSPVTIDNEGPAAPTGSVTGGIETSGTIGFNAFLNISWTAVSDATLRGYRIRFRPVTTPASAYSYVDSPGNGTTFRITGLASGTSYEVQIAAYDEFNNTSSSYQTLTNSPVSTGGVPFIGTNVSTTGYFEAGVSGTDTGVFRFGYGVATGKRGLSFNTNNYWYIDSSQSASLKVGGSDNYVTWDGSSLIVAGDLQAKKGSFSGNVSIASSASLYSGTLTGNTVTSTGDTGGSLSGSGYILNNGGLIFNSPTVNGITRIDSDTGRLTTKEANIGGWIVNDNSISKTQFIDDVAQGTISLNSTAGYISVSNDNVSGKTAGINSSSSPTDLAFWSGGTGPTNASSNSFRVQLNGDLFASNAEITGVIKARQGGFGTIVDGVVTKGWEIDTDGIVAKTSGRIKVGAYSIKVLNNTDFQIHDDSSDFQQSNILYTNTVSNVTGDARRIFLGDDTRQVEVGKSGAVQTLGSMAFLVDATTTDLQQYRSGGLRNMFTVTQSNLHQTEPKLNDTYPILDFPSAVKGDILIVYDPQKPSQAGNWRKIVGMYIKTTSNAAVNTVAPAVSPSTGTIGVTQFSSTTGTWTADTAIIYFYEWKYYDPEYDWIPAPGTQNLSTYTAPNTWNADGTELRCYVTAQAGGSYITVHSNTVTLSASSVTPPSVTPPPASVTPPPASVTPPPVTQYTVTWDADGGTGGGTTGPFNSGISHTAPTVTRSGFLFSNWRNPPSGGDPIIISAGGSYNPTSNITFTAIWTAYSVTYNCNGGTGCPADTTHTGSYTIPNTAPTRSGYTLSTYYAYINDTFVGGYSPGSTITINNYNITLVAQWNAVAVTPPPPASVTPPPASVTPPPASVTPPPASVTPPPASVTPPPATTWYCSVREEEPGSDPYLYQYTSSTNATTCSGTFAISCSTSGYPAYPTLPC